MLVKIPLLIRIHLHYAANIEMAPVVIQYEKSTEEAKEVEKVLTENQKTIADVSSFLNVQKQQCIKSLLFKVDEQFVLVLVRGDHEVNDIKLKNLYQAGTVELADPEETLRSTRLYSWFSWTSRCIKCRSHCRSCR